MKKLVAIIGIFAILTWTGWRLWYVLALRAVDETDTSRVSVTVPEGATAGNIADILAEKNVIRSPKAFVAYADKSDRAAGLQAGTFILRRSMPVAEIIEALAGGKREEVSVTIPEGYTVKDIDALLARAGLITEGELVACANTCDFSTFDFLPGSNDLAQRGGRIEGYLYPDTYFVAPADFHPKFFIERLLGTFRARVMNAYEEDMKRSGRTLHEIVTMASLVEEETRTAVERPMVAGILWKRLDEGIGLYVDASNRYIADKPTAQLTQADLTMDTPYNLRKYRGLPPGPIANVSKQSIEATLNPEKSPYYYYLHDATGIIRYAVTNDEHNINKARYLR